MIVYVDEMQKSIMRVWKKYLGNEKYNVFENGNLEKGDIESLEKILKEGPDAVLNLENELMEYNLEYIYEMFEGELSEFITDGNLSDTEEMIIKEDSDFKNELRFEFETHVNMNYESLYDYDVLIVEKRYPVYYDGIQNKIDWKDSQSVAFRKRALKYINKEDLQTILINSYDGEGYIAAIVNGKDLIDAVINKKKTVGGNVVVGVHDWFNGSGYFEESKDYIQIKLKDAIIDSGDYSVGGVFGTVNWNY